MLILLLIRISIIGQQVDFDITVDIDADVGIADYADVDIDF